MGNMSGSYGDHYNLRIGAYVIGQDYGRNISVVRADLWLDFDGSSYWAYTNNETYGYININGNVLNLSVPSINFSYDVEDSIYLGTHDVEVQHNNDGTCGAVTAIGYWDTSTARIGEGQTSSSTVPPSIPRYTSISNSERGKSLNTISVNWATGDARDWTQYSLNDGPWTDAGDTVAPDNRSGYYTIGGLQPNTQYKVRTRCKRADSQLWSEADAVYITTYDIAKITTLNNIDLGSNLIVNYTNPSGIATQIAIKSLDGNTFYIDYRDCLNNSYTYTFTDAELDKFYKLFNTANTIKVKVYLKISENNVDYFDNKEVTITLAGNQKTGHIKINNNWKRSKKWIKVNGNWKRCVRWINVNGTWKRCI